MRRVILNADDLGLCSTINKSVNRCFQDGILTSTSLMTPAPFAKNALLLASQSNWNDKIGLHLTFTAEWPTYKWKPLSNNTNLMEGDFFPTEALIFTSQKDITNEIQLQYNFMVSQGVVPNHLDDHMFSLNSYYDIVIDLCKNNNLRLRYPKKEPYKKMNKDRHDDYVKSIISNKISTIDYLFKYPYTFDINTTYPRFKMDFFELIASLPEGVSEIYMHPCDIQDDSKRIYDKRTQKRCYYEYKLLLDGEFYKHTIKEGIELISWNDI